ncbi:hypothetical protein [Sphingobacterium ginsenosidimutans]|uniref:Nuclear transport factor 2 family protein n=1 Tax=Sphingobacterium ginsenosidimutans TaxID=687845 RepID=A0ABP8ABE3_9SPHI
MKTRVIIQAYFSCYEKSDRNTLENLIDDRLEFSSPHDEKLDKVTYFEKCWGFNKKVDRYEILKFVENNDEAFISYRAITYDNHQFENAEYFQIQGAKIIKIKVYYGNLPSK